MNELATRTPIVIATEINSIKDQTRKMVLFNSIEIGRRLAEAKSLVPHGEWGKWLEEQVDYSKSTANNLMKIFEQYGNDQLSLFGTEAKSQALGNLSYTQAVALLGVPEHEREAFIQENDVENMSTRELQNAIKEKKDLEKKLQETEERAEKDREAKEKLEAEKKVAAKKMEKLANDLKAAEVSCSQEDVKELRDKIKSLEKQLKEKPIDVPTIVEKVPDEVQAELEELRKKALQNADKAVVKFSVQFETIVKNFGDLLATLSEIQEQDKYKTAVRGLLKKMEERL